jgi:NADH-quinone oxidoreductase subunit H
MLLSIAILTLIERKVMSSVQRRRGPSIVGLFGILQPFADGIKLLLKEITIPYNSNVVLFIISPIFTLFCTFLLWFSIPLIDGFVLIEIPFSILLLLSISALNVYGIIFAGWSSNSKYAFLGSIRAAAQVISYEICMSTILVIIVLIGNTYSIIEIIHNQQYIWNIVPLLPIWVLFIIVSLAETNRAPFDLPEAEAELVAGYNVEYSAITFAMFFLAEYGNIIIMSSVSTALFFGGWHAITVVVSDSLWSSLIFTIKVITHIFIYLLIRAAFPRYRYDQLMQLGWKTLIPASFCLVFIVYSMNIFYL